MIAGVDEAEYDQQKCLIAIGISDYYTYSYTVDFIISIQQVIVCDF
jgi:hypothetical protein